MILLPYDLAKLPISTLLRPTSDAGSMLSRLDERIARSAVGEGFVERSHFTDACASLWIDGELVHRRPRPPRRDEGYSHADPRADNRSRCFAHPPTHSLSVVWLGTFCRRNPQPAGPSGDGGFDGAAVSSEDEPAADGTIGGGQRDNGVVDESVSLPGVDYAAIDALLARSNAAIEQAKTPAPPKARGPGKRSVGLRSRLG